MSIDAHETVAKTSTFGTADSTFIHLQKIKWGHRPDSCHRTYKSASSWTSAEVNEVIRNPTSKKQERCWSSVLHCSLPSLFPVLFTGPLRYLPFPGTRVDSSYDVFSNPLRTVETSLVPSSTQCNCSRGSETIHQSETRSPVEWVTIIFIYHVHNLHKIKKNRNVPWFA